MYVPLSFFSLEIQNNTGMEAWAITLKRKTTADTFVGTHRHDNMNKNAPSGNCVCTRYVSNGTDVTYSHSFHANLPIAETEPATVHCTVSFWTHSPQFFYPICSIVPCKCMAQAMGQIARALLLLLFVSLNSRILYCACTESTRL